MNWFFASGHIVDLVLTLTVAEALAMLSYRRLTGRGPRSAGYLVGLTAGIWLMLALRVALTGGWWGWIALCLLGSLVAHLADLARRWTD